MQSWRGSGLHAALLGIAVCTFAVTVPANAPAAEVDEVQVGFRDGTGKDIDVALERASLERTPPERAPPTADAKYEDPDALRVTAMVPPQAAVPSLGVESLTATGTKLDRIPEIALESVTCPPLAPARFRCFATVPLRFVVDEIDRAHPVVEARSLRAEVGGAIVVLSKGRKLQTLRVAGPRNSPVGPIPRLRATLRPFVLRNVPGGGPAIGGNDAGAMAQLRTELALASAVWGQCGVTFGPAQALDVRVIDPPPPHLVAFGDDMGLPASGGEVRVRIDGREVTLNTRPRESADRAAREFAAVASRAGFMAVVSPNARIGPGAMGSVDVSLRRKSGQLASAELVNTTDSTLSVRVGAVDFSDGLQHFGDMDSMAGTLEERTLIKALDDGDPTTIELIVIPQFAGGGRIGESFIQSDLSSVRNVVLLDRAGVRARRSSLTLAHELGHVLMNVPGHPDDYGIDTPTLLMDSDASDASPFGPRRLTIDECARVVRESGPRAKIPLLVEWPLGPLKEPPRIKPARIPMRDTASPSTPVGGQ
ncbi:hypothetical protein [Pendulispora albinea]|uniref:Uncharacterized protein n=1 Tax=Pendulispora albinea TaxID=2741071 RepID=A0ABZ2LK13_9BACT